VVATSTTMVKSAISTNTKAMSSSVDLKTAAPTHVVKKPYRAALIYVNEFLVEKSKLVFAIELQSEILASLKAANITKIYGFMDHLDPRLQKKGIDIRPLDGFEFIMVTSLDLVWGYKNTDIKKMFPSYSEACGLGADEENLKTDFPKLYSDFFTLFDSTEKLIQNTERVGTLGKTTHAYYTGINDSEDCYYSAYNCVVGKIAKRLQLNPTEFMLTMLLSQKDSRRVSQLYFFSVNANLHAEAIGVEGKNKSYNFFVNIPVVRDNALAAYRKNIAEFGYEKAVKIPYAIPLANQKTQGAVKQRRRSVDSNFVLFATASLPTNASLNGDLDVYHRLPEGDDQWITHAIIDTPVTGRAAAARAAAKEEDSSCLSCCFPK